MTDQIAEEISKAWSEMECLYLIPSHVDIGIFLEKKEWRW